MANEQLIRLALYETSAVVPVQVFAPATHTIKLHAEGNSLLSTVYVKSLDPGASVLVKYWDFGPGEGENPGERIELAEHALINTANTSDRLTVSALHNKPRIEIIVAGGNAEVGVYVSVVSTFASDLDSALKKHLQNANLLTDKGLVGMGYDATSGKFYFLPIEGGALKVTGDMSIEEAGEKFAIESTSGQVASANSQINITAIETVPSGKVWRLHKLQGFARCFGFFEIYVDGFKLSGVRLNSGPASENPRHEFRPYRELTAGQTVVVKYTHSYGPGSDIGCSLDVTEVDV